MVLDRRNQLLLVGYAPFTEAVNPLVGLDSLLNSQLAKDWQLKIMTIGKLTELKEAVRQGDRFIVSDGSYRNEAGAAAWIIEGRSGGPQPIGTMITLGSTKDQRSFCSELTGVYGALCTLEALQVGEKQVQFRIASDGKSVLDRIISGHPVLPTEPHADLLQAVKSKVCQLGFRFQWCHVKGHQDGNTPTALTRDTWLNIKADLLAKNAVNPQYIGPKEYRIPGEGWICYIGQKRIVKQLVETLQNHINVAPVDKHWKQKFQISDRMWQSIDWYGLGRAYKESSPTTRRWATKHTSGFFAHGKNMARWHFRSSTRCPRCEAEGEDKAHITKCPNEDAALTWQKSLNKLATWFRESNTAHEIAEAILWGLKQWREPQRHADTPTGKYVVDQLSIGWDRFLDGWVAKSWRMSQETAWQGVRSRRSS